MRQSSQVGSIIAYVGVAVVLAAVLIGGVYVIRQQTADKQPTATSAQQPVVTTDTSERSKQQEKEKSESAASTESTQKETVEDQAKQSSATAPLAVELPQTGGSGALYVALVAALLTGIGTAYVQSRRQFVSF